MLYSEPYNTFDTGLRNARSVLSMEWMYDSLKHFLGRVLVFLFVAVLGLPLVLLFGLWLQVKRKKFRKVMKDNPPVLNNSQNYLNLKTGLRTFKQLKPTLKKIADSDLKKTPFLLRYTAGQMKKMSSTLLTYTEWLESHVNRLNTEQFKSETKEFKFLPEKELWKNRNKAYQYWM